MMGGQWWVEAFLDAIFCCNDSRSDSETDYDCDCDCDSDADLDSGLEGVSASDPGDLFQSSAESS